MTKVFYFTTALSNKDYKEYLSFWNVSPNLSNQNFHNKFIRSLAISHHVEVISTRPINSNYKLKTLHSASKKEKNITWNYIKVSSNRIDKFLNTINRILKVCNKKMDKESTIFVDVLNRALLKSALKAKKRYGSQVIGICTDNPYNISYVSKRYGNKIIHLSSKLDGYVVLTDKLQKLFNRNDKPSIIIDGLTENVNYESNIKIEGKYLFFGGSLMRKYGVYNLINAFKKLNKEDLKLVICGHHDEPDLQSNIRNIRGIEYLGALSYQDVIAVEKGSLCAINPRPIDPQIDEYSIPSKTLEYLASGVLTICVDNALLKTRYDDAIIWAKSGDTEDLCQAIEKVLSLSINEKEKLISNGIRYTEQYTSLESINKQINKLFL